MSRHYQLIRRDGTVYTSSQREKVEDRIRADWPEATTTIPLVRKRAYENALRHHVKDAAVDFILQVIGEEAVQYVNPDGKVVATITYVDS
jgi:hypothetical protein